MRILVTGGGTGGHIYPALAVIRKLINTSTFNVQIKYVGTKKGMEADIIPDNGIDFASITVRGLKRAISLEQVYFVRDFLKGYTQSKKIISSFQPQVVLGTGGYVCGPVIMAAKMKKIPTVIHEQNVIPGITNKLLSRMTNYTCLSFPESEKYFSKAKKIVVTGNPRAQEIVERDYSQGYRTFDIDPDKKTLLVVSGSRGAKVINETVMAILPELSRVPDLQVIYVTGQEYYSNVKDILSEKLSQSEQNRIKVYPYLSDLPVAINCADLVISRAGATTLAELTAAEKPTILIPSPNVTNDHQNVNAKILEQRGAAKVINEKQLQSDELLHLIHELIGDDSILDEMSKASGGLGYPNAATKLSDLLTSID